MKTRHTGYAHRVDGNQDAIRAELRLRGFTVDNVSQLKKLYDVVVTGRMFGTNEVRTVRVEIKQPGEDLTPDEKKYHAAEAYPETLLIAYSIEDVLRWFGHI